MTEIESNFSKMEQKSDKLEAQICEKNKKIEELIEREFKSATENESQKLALENKISENIKVHICNI